jgi:hypothetical protein
MILATTRHQLLVYLSTLKSRTPFQSNCNSDFLFSCFFIFLNLKCVSQQLDVKQMETGCWTFLLTSAPEVQLMVASSTPAGTPVFRFHAVRSPTDRDDDLSVFFFVGSTESAASPSGAGGSSAKRSLFVLDSLTGILAVAADVNLHDRVTRNKGNAYIYTLTCL